MAAMPEMRYKQMKIMLITSNHAPEVVELVENEDKLRQCAARLGCTPDKLIIENEEIDEEIVSLLKAPAGKDEPVTGVNYADGSPAIHGNYIICRYYNETGLIRGLSDLLILKFKSGIREGIISTFNASRAKYEERKAARERELNSPAAISATAMIYSSFISAMRIEYGNRYINNVDGSGRVYRDILSEHPDIAEFVRKHPDKMPAYAKYLD